MNSPGEFEAEIAAVARREGKFVAIAHYRGATGAGVRRARRAVEVILWRHGIASMTPPRFFPWYRVLLLGGSVFVGLLIAWGLVVLFH
jgi:hypothetical protein